MNFRHLGLTCLALLVGAPGLLADTIPGGNVSGTWYHSNSPYYIAGNITVAADDTLVIEPGVEVNFLGYYAFGVLGLLDAVGTQADSIRFTASTDWFGMSIANAPDSSRLEYCVLEADNAFQGLIYCGNSNPIISHCRISNNTSYETSGGVTLVNSGARISHCLIAGNSGIGGCGVRCRASSPRITNCSIIGNSTLPLAGSGGGISAEEGSHPVIDSCVIRGNRATRGGGGVAVTTGSSCTIADCIIAADSTYGGQARTSTGGGIYVNSPGGSVAISGSVIDSCYSQHMGGGICIQAADSVSLVRCILDANRATQEVGGAIYSSDSGSLVVDHCNLMNSPGTLGSDAIILDGAVDLVLTNSIFRSHYRYNIYFSHYSSALVAYSDFFDWGAPAGPFGGSPPAGLGQLVQTNANGDSCDVYYNILLDPMFADFPNRNYNLTFDSPCIDAGDPDSPRDPDSTCTDMGALYFFQTDLAEARPPQVRSGGSATTVVRGVLYLPRDMTELRPGNLDRVPRLTLLDATGRMALALRAGRNDVSTLSPGIYFVKSTLDNRHSTMSKVIITR